MGTAISHQVSNQIINNSYSIATNAIQKCKASASSQFKAEAGGNCHQNITTVNLTNGTEIEASCVQNVTTNASMQAQITAQVISQVNAAAASLGGPSVSIADSLNDFAQYTAETISNQFTSVCTGLSQNTASFGCGDSATQNIGTINVDNTTSEYLSCANSATVSDNLKNILSDKISSTTAAKETDTLTTIVVIVLIFLGIFGFIFVRTLNGPIGWVVVIIVVALIIGLIVYAIFAFSRGLYPFNSR